jgi:hypothetical protein
MVLDATGCPTNHPSSDIQKIYYSEKHKHHEIKYEIGVHPKSGKIAWTAGPAPGSMHDKNMTVYFGLLAELEKDDIILGDKEYIGIDQVITPLKKSKKRKLTNREKELNQALGSHQ